MKLSIDEVNRRLDLVQLKLIGEFINVNTNASFKCFCGQTFVTKPLRIFRKDTISCGCINKARQFKPGINHPNYNPLLTDEDRLLRRKSPEYKSWAKEVYKRDNYICQVCGTKKKPFNAHHLDGWNWCRNKRLDIDNGITLCVICHNKFHHEYGRCDTTKEQFVEFQIKNQIRST